MKAHGKGPNHFDPSFASGMFKELHTHYVPERFQYWDGVDGRPQPNVCTPDTNDNSPVLRVGYESGVVWEACYMLNAISAFH